MKSIISLFLSQSYQDAWDDYVRSLNRDYFARWDYIILTASNEQQAEGFRKQIEERINSGYLSNKTHYAVLPDPNGVRVGSGGATLNVIRYISQQESSSDFSGKRILVIHSGGDSKRVPQYSALGKLFSPVPRKLPDGRSSTLFDEFIIGMSGVPGRIREGMLLLSGDVLLLFNPLQIDFSGRGAAAISFKEDVEVGKNHGIFLVGKDGNVEEFLHKQPVSVLKEKGAVNSQNCVDIDTGAIIFSTEIIEALYGLISENGVVSSSKFDTYVNEKVRLSLYGDFLYPLASCSTLEQFYLEKPEGEQCDELKSARSDVWSALHSFSMKVMRLSPAKFLHFGTTREIMNLVGADISEYSHLGWEKWVNSSIENKNVAAYNSVLSGRAKCGDNTYLEVSYVHSSAIVGKNVILSYVDIHDEIIPDNVVLHGLKQKDGKFVVRIYGVDDNPKKKLEENCSFLGTSLADFMSKNRISADELWGDGEHYLWFAKLYPACDSINEAVAAALNIYKMAHGEGNVNVWRSALRKSLCAGFNDADSSAVISWERHMHEIIQMDRLSKIIRSKEPVENAREIFHETVLSNVQNKWFERRIANADFSESMRLYYYVGKLIGGAEGERYIDRCFSTISDSILKSTLDALSFNSSYRICHDEYDVKLPLRVNWGGGWSDTPPYCNENGGTVLNAAVSLNGILPVHVKLKKLEEKKIVFDSCDMGSYGEFSDIESLQRYGDPYDQFALQKAALIVCGIIPLRGGCLEDILADLGGGIYMSTEVVGVPKGSGLGTSSILAGACVKALLNFIGLSRTEDEIYDYVLRMEQLMSTGGGWQDQVGGLSGGIKYITSRPGMIQKLNVEHIQIDKETLDELNNRMVLIYTGQRRLARNLLRNVVGNYIGNNKNTVYALSEIQKIAALMRFELERNNIDGFAELLSKHWELSKVLDSGSTNTCIDHIFSAIDDLIEGKMICGAGGGGFLQVILKKDVSAEMLRTKLRKVFQDSGVKVWKCKIVD